MFLFGNTEKLLQINMKKTNTSPAKWAKAVNNLQKSGKPLDIENKMSSLHEGNISVKAGPSSARRDSLRLQGKQWLMAYWWVIATPVLPQGVGCWLGLGRCESRFLEVYPYRLFSCEA